jgi:hypothetical protein
MQASVSVVSMQTVWSNKYIATLKTYRKEVALLHAFKNNISATTVR